MSIYLNDWKDGCFIELVANFEDIYITAAEYAAEVCPHRNEPYWLEMKAALTRALADPKWQNLEVLLASYGYADYSGDAFVLFRRDGKLYEVNASHCSCYGVEGQWEPEETTVEALMHRLDNGNLGSEKWGDCNVFADELRQVLSSISGSQP